MLSFHTAIRKTGGIYIYVGHIFLKSKKRFVQIVKLSFFAQKIVFQICIVQEFKYGILKSKK